MSAKQVAPTDADVPDHDALFEQAVKCGREKNSPRVAHFEEARDTKKRVSHYGIRQPHCDDAACCNGWFGGIPQLVRDLRLLFPDTPAGENRERGHVIELLPALPKEWPRGAVRGIRARGGVEIDMMWSDGALLLATIRTRGVEPLRVAWPEGAPLPTISRVSDGVAVTPARVGKLLLIAPAGAPDAFRVSKEVSQSEK